MAKKFCTTGTCIPEKNYMVDLSNRIQQIINQYIESGQYFTINRARQYGKTTLLYLLEKELRKQDYLVLSLSFEAADEYFESLGSLAEGLSLDIEECLREQNVDEKVLEEWNHSISERFPMRSLGTKISNLCRKCGKKVVLMIDEVDKSSDNQIFLSFLGLLREKYLKCQQGKDVTFHSVILAGVYDIKTLKLKLHPQEESKYNSPWNIAVDFNIEMSFSVSDIQTMIQEYEQEHRTGMDVKEISRIFETQLYDMFLSETAVNNQMYMKVSSDRNQFIVSGMLQMPLVMQKFYEYYEEIYSEKDQKFIEENGRKLFLLFLKPIINGTGNYYIEARTRDNKRTDIIIDYKGKQFVIELKIWRGNEYNQRARQQIFEYLDYYQKEEGYLLSFNFNKNKETGIKKIEYKGKHIIETVV